MTSYEKKDFNFLGCNVGNKGFTKKTNRAFYNESSEGLLNSIL